MIDLRWARERRSGRKECWRRERRIEVEYTRSLYDVPIMVKTNVTGIKRMSNERTKIAIKPSTM